MKHLSSFKRAVVFCSTAIITGLCCSTGYGTTIDFNNIPDGTPVSAGNPYLGYVNIQASGRIDMLVGQSAGVGIVVVIAEVEAEIQNGAVQVLLPDHPGFLYFRSELNVDFLQPVKDLDFDVESAVGVIYHFSALNGHGDKITGGGSNEIPGDVIRTGPVAIDLPDGYFLTQFGFWMFSFGPANASFRLNDLSFTPASVPDHGRTSTFLALSCAGLFVVRRMIRPANRLILGPGIRCTQRGETRRMVNGLPHGAWVEIVHDI